MFYIDLGRGAGVNPREKAISPEEGEGKAEVTTNLFYST